LQGDEDRVVGKERVLLHGGFEFENEHGCLRWTAEMVYL
jgi:hypothetical protein